jgi:hypothetical protein
VSLVEPVVDSLLPVICSDRSNVGGGVHGNVL